MNALLVSLCLNIASFLCVLLFMSKSLLVNEKVVIYGDVWLKKKLKKIADPAKSGAAKLLLCHKAIIFLALCDAIAPNQLEVIS